MLELALREHGFSTRTAARLDDAIRVSDEVDPALVLLDLRLTDGDGRQFVAGRTSAAPVIVMTASEDAAAAARSIGAQGHLAKPFDLTELYELVDRFLERP
jgi:DNA-binding response OmpR family regulator